MIAQLELTTTHPVLNPAFVTITFASMATGVLWQYSGCPVDEVQTEGAPVQTAPAPGEEIKLPSYVEVLMKRLRATGVHMHMTG